MLADRLEEMEKGAESRVAIVRDVKSRKKSSAAKKSRRKYRALEEAKRAEMGEEMVGEEEEDGEVKEIVDQERPDGGKEKPR